MRNYSLNWGLAYPSKRYPQAINEHHPNVRHEFFHEMVKQAKRNHMRVWLVVEFPDRCLGLIRRMPCLALKQSADAVLHNIAPQWWRRFFKGDVPYPEFRILQAGGGGLAVESAATMRFWKAFWRELLTAYPEIDGIGLELCEHLEFNPRQPSFCDQMWRYYRAMVDVSEKVRPGLAYWMWYAPGGRVVAERRREFDNFTYVYWGDGAERPPRRRAQGAKVDWYLTHGGVRQDYEPWIKRHCMACERLGISGIQKRMAVFRPLHNVYSAFAEFSWSPKTTWARYALHHLLRTHHRKDFRGAARYAASLRKGCAVSSRQTREADAPTVA